MRSRCMRRRPSHFSHANCMPLNVGFPVRLGLTSAHAPRSRRGGDSTHYAGDSGAHAERRLRARSGRDGRRCLRLVRPPTSSSSRSIRISPRAPGSPPRTSSMKWSASSRRMNVPDRCRLAAESPSVASVAALCRDYGESRTPRAVELDAWVRASGGVRVTAHRETTQRRLCAAHATTSRRSRRAKVMQVRAKGR